MAKNQRLDTQTARVVVGLRDMIMKGELRAGERLVEAVLSDRLQASRTPVRSALLTLEQQGLVERLRGGGYTVRSYTAREIAEAISVHACLEGMAARLVAEKGVSRGLSNRLQACLDEGDRIVAVGHLDMEDIAAYLANNVRFHGLIVEAADNQVLKQSLHFLDRIPFAAAGGMLPFHSTRDDCDEAMRFAQRQHHSLVEALRNGQGARAQALAEEHRQIALFNLQHATQHAEIEVGISDALPVLRMASL
ncbi:GntR family transcriptional regulator [Pusillimonas caeni]|uniref:GntR family transcriptional regulator n=1 Tax=Pusillimonas caeni TaxID=1348472 RepID=UPI000E59E372|nr:GntR family transcriptional regulator [Pusillimonas caeni]TFL14360.1 GntR family transcriptional regulator [Pusillimonas caeni]